MMVQRELTVVDRPQHGVAHRLTVIQLFGVRGFKCKPFQMNGLHHGAVAREDGGPVEMARIRQAFARPLLAPGEPRSLTLTGALHHHGAYGM